MATSIEAARLLVWRAAWMASQGQKFDKAEGSMSKLFAGETAIKVTEKAMQILGGNGFTRDYPVERVGARREDLHDLRGHQRDPAAGDRTDDLRRPDPLTRRLGGRSHPPACDPGGVTTTAADTRPSVRTLGLVLLADLVCVVAFAAAGKGSHEAGASPWVVAAIVWPFVVAVLVAHAGLVRVGRPTERVWPEGAVVVAATYVLGLGLRVVSGRGIAPGFLVVTLIFLALTMLGWRAVRRLVVARRA